MKFSQATIAAIVALSSLIGATEPHRRPRSLKSKNSHAATQTNQNTTASVLAAQTGTGCFLTPSELTGVYYLDMNKINPVTTLFDERPLRQARTVSSANFTAKFDTIFGADPPNAAITITPNPDVTIIGGTGHHNNTVFIVTLSDPGMKYAGGGITYTVSQSPSQADVSSLKSWYNDGQEGTSSDNSCSIFIDSITRSEMLELTDG